MATRIYTRTGDDGSTGLFGGPRVSKSSPRIDCYGTVDELNAVLGVVGIALRDSAAAVTLTPIIARVQNELFNLGAELATPDAARRARSPKITAAEISRLESEIDQLDADLPALRTFILPGGGAASAHLHLARTVCRRAERLLVALAADDPDAVSHEALQYLNRLSDALFVFGRFAAAADNEPEPLWTP